jgi:hypothetical protein
MDPFEEGLALRNELQQERLHLVYNELALASTFLDVAKTTRQSETRERNIRNAQKACEAVTEIIANNSNAPPSSGLILRTSWPS